MDLPACGQTVVPHTKATLPASPTKNPNKIHATTFFINEETNEMVPSDVNL